MLVLGQSKCLRQKRGLLRSADRKLSLKPYKRTVPCLSLRPFPKGPRPPETIPTINNLLKGPVLRVCFCLLENLVFFFGLLEKSKPGLAFAFQSVFFCSPSSGPLFFYASQADPSS